MIPLEAFHQGKVGWWFDMDKTTAVFATKFGGTIWVTHYNGVVSEFFEAYPTDNFDEATGHAQKVWRRVPPLRPTLDEFQRMYVEWWLTRTDGHVTLPPEQK